MSRGLSLTILLLAVLAIGASLQLTRGSASDSGCGGVRTAYERVAFVEGSNDVPTAEVYAEASRAVRETAVEAPPAVAENLGAVADAYERLADLLDGFDPADASTYPVYEENVTAIEDQEVLVDTNLPEVEAWLDQRCR